MGLDNAWVLPGDNDREKHPEFDPPLRLVGGLFSDHGRGSFRGKVYDDIINHITGESLYQIEIPNERVREMARKIREFKVTKKVYEDCHHFQGDTYERFTSEMNDIRRMFDAYAEAGAKLVGWW